MPKREYYADNIINFLSTSTNEILGTLTTNHDFDLESTQKEAWKKEIEILKTVLSDTSDGRIYFEFSIPRMGKRIDVLLIIASAIIVLEFKVGEKEYVLSAVDQVWDYALDLNNFHETSHNQLIAPILVSTAAPNYPISLSFSHQSDNVLFPIRTNVETLKIALQSVLVLNTDKTINVELWEKGRYSPTPSIIEAAMALYNNHSVADISRTDAAAINLSHTSSTIQNIIQEAKANKRKSLCFITGVPGAGKTLVGLDIATKNINKDEGLTSIFLSGNGPLVAILREALTRDRIKREKALGNKLKKKEVSSQVKVFIQNVHHFRDECLLDAANPPFDHVAIFDEAQRAWNHEQTAKFMKAKKTFQTLHTPNPNS
jgi:hypothetical protein